MEGRFANLFLLRLMEGGSHKSKVGLVFGIIGGILCFIFLVSLFVLWKRRMRRYRPDVFVDVAGVILSNYIFKGSYFLSFLFSLQVWMIIE